MISTYFKGTAAMCDLGKHYTVEIHTAQVFTVHDMQSNKGIEHISSVSFSSQVVWQWSIPGIHNAEAVMRKEPS